MLSLKADREILLKANKIREDLERYNSRAFFDNRNLEDILSLLSFEALNGKEQAAKYDTLVKAVARTIELCCTCTFHESTLPLPISPDHYHLLWRALLGPAVKDACPALITFNYDLVLERKLWELFHCFSGSEDAAIGSCSINYHFGIYDFVIKRTPHRYSTPHHGLQAGYRPEFHWYEDADVNVPYLKLHGSLNWHREWSMKNPLAKEQKVTPASGPTKVVEDPLILPPVFNKMNSSLVNGVWSKALEVLRNAKNIIIVGYSLPKTDIYMQYFLKSAVGPNSNLQRIIVFDPILFKNGNDAQEMKDRYLACFAPQFTNRISFNPPSPDRFSSGNGTFYQFVRTLIVHPEQLLFYP